MNINKIRVYLDADRSAVPLELVQDADYLFCCQANDRAANAEVAFDKANDDRVPIFAGWKIKWRIRRLWLWNSVQMDVSGVAKWLDILFVKGTPPYGFENTPGRAADTGSDESVLPVFSNIPGCTTIAIGDVAAELGYTGLIRGTMIVTNSGATTIRIAHTAADVEDDPNSYLLLPGATLALYDYRGHLWAHQSGAAGQLTILETRFEGM